MKEPAVPHTHTIAAIGGGGKTTLLTALYHALPGRVALTTTTHMLVPEGERCFLEPAPAEVRTALRQGPAVVLGPVVETVQREAWDPQAGRARTKTFRKAAAPSPQVLSALEEETDALLVEADGSRGLPLKLHGPGEPAVPQGTDLVVFIAGLNALGMRGRDAVHRAERMEAVLGKSPEETVTQRDIVLAAGAANKAAYRRYAAVLNRAGDIEAANAVSRVLMEEFGIPSLLLPELNTRLPGWEQALAQILLAGLAKL